ncbi:hypothetical protein GCM10009839_45460 [Catenulispora yoronensis]|uniref:Caspase domain-containing protein n=1 Tax=Catenulispora yoronensis TaxID=450799 RepID=A0ABP5G3Y2_9ACTN
MSGASAPTGRRRALIVATGTYTDRDLRRLRAPAKDAVALAEVLAAPHIGGFEVVTVLDGSDRDIRMAIEDLVADADPADLLLVYVSCHGLLDEQGRLYFAAADTQKGRLAATGVEAEWILQRLEQCRARQQVLILDSCFSGAFTRAGAKGEDDALQLRVRFHGGGRGRVVLTASTAYEYSFEGTGLGAEAGSVFTAALVEGLRTGAADVNGDGRISVDDVADYVFDRVKESGSPQTPQRWLYGAQGTIVLALAQEAARPGRKLEEAPAPPPTVRQSSHMRVNTAAPWSQALAGLQDLLVAGRFAAADQATTDAILQAVASATTAGRGPRTSSRPRAFLQISDADSIPGPLLDDLDRCWTHHTDGVHGFTAQLAKYSGPGDGVPAKGHADFLVLAQALGWDEARHQKFEAFVAAAGTAPGFFPTLRHAAGETRANWPELWERTVLTVHLRLRDWRANR